MPAHRTTRTAALVIAAALSTAAAGIAGAQPAPAASPSPPAFSIAWSVVLESPLVAPPSSLGGRVFVPLRTGQLLAVDRESGRELWRAAILAERAVAVDQGRLIVVTVDSLVALDAAAGKPLWRLPLKDSAAAPVARGGWVLVGLESGDLLALRGADGSLVWRARLGVAPRSPPAVDGDRVYAALGDGSVVALDLTTGREVWRTTLSAAAGAITPAGDRLFVGCRDNFFYSLDAGSGKRRWRWRTGADIAFGAAFDQSRVYFVSLDNLLRALDVRSGALEWRQPLDTRPMTAPLLAGDRVTVAGLGAELLVFKAADGSAAGKWTAPAELSVAPLLFAPSDGTFLRAVVVTGDASGTWHLYGVAPSLEPVPGPLTEIPGRQLSPDGPPAPRESPKRVD